MKKPHVLLPAAVVMLFLVITALNWLPWPGDVDVSGELVARAVTLTPAEDLDLEPGVPLAGDKPIRLGGFDSSDGLGTNAAVMGRATLHGQSAADLSEIHVAGGGTLTVALTGPATQRILTLLARGRAALALTVTDHPTAEPAIPDITAVRIAATGGSATPLFMQAALSGPSGGVGDAPPWSGSLSMTGVRVAGIRFGEESLTQADQRFVSSIKVGHITLPQTGDLFSLGTTSPLQLENFSGTILVLVLAPDGVHVVFGGHVRRVSLGQPGFQEDVTPTVFGVLVHIRAVQFIFATLGLLFATLLPEIYRWKKERDKPPAS